MRIPSNISYNKLEIHLFRVNRTTVMVLHCPTLPTLFYVTDIHIKNCPIFLVFSIGQKDVT